MPLSTQEVSLSTNLVGKWNIPGDTNISSSTVNIGTFMGADVGLYTFYTNNWYEVEVTAMQISISSSLALIGNYIINIIKLIKYILLSCKFLAMTPEQVFVFNDTRFGYLVAVQ